MQALERDGFRCVVTGKYDLAASISISEQQVIAAGGAVNTECAHIVPDSTYFNVSNTSTSSSVKVNCYMCFQFYHGSNPYPERVFSIRVGGFEALRL